ncbi:MAG: hypothetical protein OHK0046_26610 [Anaerolineae bacterium]
MKNRAGSKNLKELGYNPRRTDDLFALTEEGYIIAQDIACQYEYILMQEPEACGQALVPVAQINRSFQGLSEIVALCPTTGERYSFIFDISNVGYQTWWAEQMGEHYEVTYDGPPRQPEHR